MIPLAAGGWWAYRRRVHKALLFSSIGRIPRLGTTARTTAARTLPLLTLAGIALCVVALARPRTVLSTVRQTADAIAIEMVVDVSGSMEALDLSIKTAAGTRLRTRLDAVKGTFADFIRKRPDDLIGIISFGGFASTRAPLTGDHSALLHVLDGINIPGREQGKNGLVANQEELLTAVGDGLATACARLEPAELKSKIVVLLSDGESNTGVISPEQAAGAAAKLGIKIYTIGVGTNGRAPFKTRDAFGREVIDWAEVTLDEKMLKLIADTTGGRYFNVTDPNGLDRAMDEINKLEKTEVDRTEFRQYDEWFTKPLLPGLIMIAMGAGLNMLVSKRLI
jgi:Ca-activated chloride channel family protein